MNLALEGFGTLVQNQAAAVSAASSTTLDFETGSVLRAILEASASQGLWLEFIATQVLRATRLSTSAGSDVDTFVEDYGLTRLPPNYATGTVTFSRFTPTLAASIPVGASVITADQSQTYVVIIDASNSNYVPATNSYNVVAGAASISVLAQAINPGTVGNIQAGAITLLGTAIPGVDTVTNGFAFVNGIDEETDAALKARFAAYIQGLARCTPQAIQYAAQSVQNGINAVVLENIEPNGTSQLGFFTVIADDGSGNPPASLLTAISGVVELYRPVGTSYAVVGPTILGVTISLTISVVNGGNTQTAAANVATAITAYVDSLPIGIGLSFGRLYQLAFSADPSVSGVNNMLVNGATSDIAGSPTKSIKISSLAVNP